MSTSSEIEKAVRLRLNSLTKPPGSLGRLEEIVLRLALIQGDAMPSVDRKGMYVFCADHGIADEGASAYPSTVTHHMMRNFMTGGAAINVLCRSGNIVPIVVDVGARGERVEGVRDCRVSNGTRSFTRGLAMTLEEANRAIEAGQKMAREAATRFEIVGLGEMGIGNTAAAAAILSVYSGRPAIDTVGPGTGLSVDGVQRKARLVQQALDLHRPRGADGRGVLAAVGGFEIAAMAGFLMEASGLKLPIVVDGFVVGAAALVARTLQPNALDTVFYGHRSHEPGHALLLRLLDAHPYLELEMRLGEGTGAALTMGLIDAAVRLYREMATFAEAGMG